MTTSAQRTPPAPSVAVAAFTARERWVLLVASAWLVIGLQLDAYAHATTPQLETFWTPWHAVLYSGIAASGFTLLWIMRSRLPAVPTYRTLLALPNALRIPLVGMALLLVGGGVDTLWHNIFGIERGLEIFVSPSHELIIMGMVLVAAGPALLLATRPDPGLSFGDAALVTISALLSALPLHIYSLHASAIGAYFFGAGDRPTDGPVLIFSRDAQMVHGYLFSTVLLLLPILILGRRWRLPFAVPTLLVAVPAVLMHLMFGSEDPWWPALTVAAAAAGTEVVLRLGSRFVPLPGEGRWIALGLLAPLLVWGTLLVAAAPEVTWNVHMVSGVLTLTAITGMLTVLVARNVRFPERHAPAEPTAADAPTAAVAPTGAAAPTAADAPTGTDAPTAADAPTAPAAADARTAPTAADARTAPDAPTAPTAADAGVPAA